MERTPHIYAGALSLHFNASNMQDWVSFCQLVENVGTKSSSVTTPHLEDAFSVLSQVERSVKCSTGVCGDRMSFD